MKEGIANRKLLASTEGSVLQDVRSSFRIFSRRGESDAERVVGVGSVKVEVPGFRLLVHKLEGCEVELGDSSSGEATEAMKRFSDFARKGTPQSTASRGCRVQQSQSAPHDYFSPYDRLSNRRNEKRRMKQKSPVLRFFSYG